MPIVMKKRISNYLTYFMNKRENPKLTKDYIFETLSELLNLIMENRGAVHPESQYWQGRSFFQPSIVALDVVALTYYSCVAFVFGVLNLTPYPFLFASWGAVRIG